MASTELSLINGALARCGRRALPSLDAKVGPTAAMALNALDRARLEILARGFTFNRVAERTFTPDATTSEIVLGDDVLAIDEIVSNGANRDIVLQDGKLYNATDDTFEFDSAVTCDVVYDKTIAQLPEIARHAIGAKASVHLAQTLGLDNNSIERIRYEALEALDIVLEKEVDSFDEPTFASRAVYPAINRRRRRY